MNRITLALLLLTALSSAASGQQRWRIRGDSRAGEPATAAGTPDRIPNAAGGRFVGSIVLEDKGQGRFAVRGERAFLQNGRDQFEGLVERSRSGSRDNYSGRVRFAERKQGLCGPLEGSKGPKAQTSYAFRLHVDRGSGAVRGVLSQTPFESLPATTSKTIVLIHGAWLDSRSWSKFRARYEQSGYQVIAPEWPLHKTERAGEVGPLEIVDHYERIIRKLPEPPILIGHSFGGLWVQMLLDRGVGAAGVAIDPAPSRGVKVRGRAIRANFPAALAAVRKDVLTIGFKSFQYGFVHTLSPEAQRSAFTYTVPTTARVFRLSARRQASVDFKKPNRAPLLMIGATGDRTVTIEMIESAFRKHVDGQATNPSSSRSVVALKTFWGKSHWLIAEPGWEEVADYALRWCEGYIASRESQR